MDKNKSMFISKTQKRKYSLDGENKFKINTTFTPLYNGSLSPTFRSQRNFTSNKTTLDRQFHSSDFTNIFTNNSIHTQPLYTTNTNNFINNSDISNNKDIINTSYLNSPFINDLIINDNLKAEPLSNISFMPTNEYINNVSEKANHLQNRISEINLLKQQIYNYENKVQSLENENLNVKEKLSFSLTKIKDLENRDKKYSEKINQINSKYDALMKENYSLKAKINDYNQTKYNQEFEQFKLQEKEKFISSNISLHNQEKLDLEKIIEESKSEFIHNETTLKNKIKEINSVYKEELKKITEEYEEQLLSLTKLNDKLSEEIEIMKDQVSSQIKERKEIEEKNLFVNDSLNKSIKEKDQLLEEIKEKLDFEVKENKKLKFEIKDIKRDNEETVTQLENKLSTLNNDKERLIKKLKEVSINESKYIRDNNQENTDDEKKELNTSSPSSQMNSPQKQNDINNFSPDNKNNSNYTHYNTNSLFINTELYNSLEKQIQYWKDISLNKQNELNYLKKLFNDDKTLMENKINKLFSSLEDKSEEFNAYKKAFYKLETESNQKEECIFHLEKEIQDIKRKYVNEISFKNEEIYRLKLTCDKILSKVSINMEKALYE